MNNTIKGLLTGLIIGLIVGSLAGYIFSGNINKGFQGRGNFQVDEKTKNEIISFFDSTKDIGILKALGAKNRDILVNGAKTFWVKVEKEFEIYN